MIFDYPEFSDIGVLVGCFDNPSAVPPVVQYGNESRIRWFASLKALPGDAPTYAVDPNGFLMQIQASNRQHPDYNTHVWPPKE
jgi:hypothetical protein